MKLNFFSTKPKEPTKFDLYRGQYITTAQAKEWFPNQFVLMQDPVVIQNKIAGGTLMHVHKKRKKVNEFAKDLPRPIHIFVCDTNEYEEIEELHVALP